MGKTVLILMFITFSINCYAQKAKHITYNGSLKVTDSLTIREGIISKHAQRIRYKKDGKTIAIIKLSEPVLIAQAEQEERWGYFQFPGIGKSTDGELRITWQMADDTYEAYGKKPVRQRAPMWSKDGGKTWYAEKKMADVRSHGYNVQLKDGSFLEVYTPVAKDIRKIKNFPKAVARKGKESFYRVEDLPEELQGVYFARTNSDGSAEIIHSSLNDPGLLRNASDNLMPVVWWGNIKRLPDESLISGVYPTYYLDEEGKVSESGVSFYISRDNGLSWKIVGVIPFCKDGIADVKGSSCYEEPAFEILKDGTFICVMRSGSSSPMYKTFSYDKGKTWTVPKPFTPNGVKPVLKLLSNGVLVLASGRPGVQLRFSIDGSGKEWTKAIDMVPFMHSDGSFMQDVSCGYVSIIETGKNSFFMVYSDFTTKNEKGEIRKSIFGRKVIIKTRY